MYRVGHYVIMCSCGEFVVTMQAYQCELYRQQWKCMFREYILYFNQNLIPLEIRYIQYTLYIYTHTCKYIYICT